MGFDLIGAFGEVDMIELDILIRCNMRSQYTARMSAMLAALGYRVLVVNVNEPFHGREMTQLNEDDDVFAKLEREFKEQRTISIADFPTPTLKCGIRPKGGPASKGGIKRKRNPDRWR